VLIEGEGERAFCAGGDIRWLYDAAGRDPAEAAGFFRTEYKMNARLAAFPKPQVALLQGVTMGGGVGLSQNADFRVVTEKTLWAMPECGIGMIPDVGTSARLSRLPGGVGLFLGLTGHRLNGADCLAAEVATHFIPTPRLGEMRALLLALPLRGGTAKAEIARALATLPRAEPGPLVEHLLDIDRHFMAPMSLVGLKQSLRADGGALATLALEAMAPASPLALALTFSLLRGAPADFADCLRREFRVTARLMASVDFREGVRAQIIDKDRKPRWSPPRLADVDAAMVEAYFGPAPGGELIL
jgi:enoyl-CoA hydratase/carnithine racemase